MFSQSDIETYFSICIWVVYKLYLLVPEGLLIHILRRSEFQVHIIFYKYRWYLGAYQGW